MSRTIESIADLCHRLAGLLEDPHPGLSTWIDARNRVACELRDTLSEQIDGVASWDAFPQAVKQ